jgi:hypothetical protein
MAGSIDGVRGGIIGLVQLLNEHGEAIEYELLTIGKHISDLGTKRLSWRDLKVVVTQSPPRGALHRSIDPKGWGWSADTYLLAALTDLSAAGNWQRAGNKNKPRPTPVPRPNQVKKKKPSLASRALKQVPDVG